MRVLKYILYFILFFYLMVLFLPKENLYFLIEHRMDEYKIILNNETLNDFGGVLTVSKPHVLYGGEEVGEIDEITILPFILYNEIDVKGLHFAKSLQNFIPSEIEKANVRATLFYPLKVWINIKGDFGEIDGSYNIYSKTIRFILKPQEGFRQKYPLIYANFKDVEGELIYESSFK